MGGLIFLALVGVPILEIAVFIEIGGRIGVGYTLALIVATALAGTALLRHQGMATLASARKTVEQGGMPMREVLDGVCLLIGGALLLTPGFVTDAVGAVLLIPFARRALQAWVVSRLLSSGRVSMSMGGSMGGSPQPGRGRGDDTVIDGDFTEVRDEDDDSLPPPGGWGSRQ